MKHAPEVTHTLLLLGILCPPALHDAPPPSVCTASVCLVTQPLLDPAPPPPGLWSYPFGHGLGVSVCNYVWLVCDWVFLPSCFHTTVMSGVRVLKDVCAHVCVHVCVHLFV